jgi:hypothetical protein
MPMCRGQLHGDREQLRTGHVLPFGKEEPGKDPVLVVFIHLRQDSPMQST